ncbi:(d)CMP kinase [Candidatus Babeliales bacterium]|nr:(d)CMP kinase [Candidatus Babeliales bacterium]
MIITIDGPAASGKSTVARVLASKLNSYYLETGLLYRAVAYILIEKNNKAFEDFKTLSEEDLNFISDISYKYINGSARIFFHKEDITDLLHSSVSSKGASIVSAVKNVRRALLELQRDISKHYDIVADGRDCGSVVFPDADYKFFLTASLEVRAKRAFSDSKRKNKDFSLEDIKKSLAARDKRDKEREISPLIIPKDAVVVDNSELDADETIEEFLKHIKR